MRSGICPTHEPNTELTRGVTHEKQGRPAARRKHHDATPPIRFAPRRSPGSRPTFWGPNPDPTARIVGLNAPHIQYKGAKRASSKTTKPQWHYSQYRIIQPLTTLAHLPTSSKTTKPQLLSEKSGTLMGAPEDNDYVSAPSSHTRLEMQKIPFLKHTKMDEQTNKN
jgi:hypothetical protein